MRLSGGVAILGEGPDSRDADARADQADHAQGHEELAGADGEPVQDDAGSDAAG